MRTRERSLSRRLRSVCILKICRICGPSLTYTEFSKYGLTCNPRRLIPSHPPFSLKGQSRSAYVPDNGDISTAEEAAYSGFQQHRIHVDCRVSRRPLNAFEMQQSQPPTHRPIPISTSCSAPLPVYVSPGQTMNRLVPEASPLVYVPLLRSVCR